MQGSMILAIIGTENDTSMYSPHEILTKSMEREM